MADVPPPVASHIRVAFILDPRRVGRRMRHIQCFTWLKDKDRWEGRKPMLLPANCLQETEVSRETVFCTCTLPSGGRREQARNLQTEHESSFHSIIELALLLGHSLLWEPFFKIKGRVQLQSVSENIITQLEPMWLSTRPCSSICQSKAYGGFSKML